MENIIWVFWLKQAYSQPASECGLMEDKLSSDIVVLVRHPLIDLNLAYIGRNHNFNSFDSEKGGLMLMIISKVTNYALILVRNLSVNL